MLGHGLTLIPGTHHALVGRLIGYFPGVPVFFFLSGFLITGSWLRHPKVGSFVTRRVLRIYPALWMALSLSTTALLILYSAPVLEHRTHFLAWLVGQATILQSWNPDFLRAYGVGVVNGALWTIPLELLFYTATPCLLFIGNRGARSWLVICIAMVISGAFYLSFVCLFVPAGPTQVVILKVFTLSPIAAVTWFWMYGFGMLAYLFRSILIPLAARHFWLLFSVYLSLAACSAVFPVPGVLKGSGNELGLINFLAIASVALSFAYSFRGLSQRILRKSDFSYGIYVYHMPIINIMLMDGESGETALIATIAIVCLLAALSWFFIEKPALQPSSEPSHGSVLHRALGR
jgi:peptidoglycan/LPS O-acetylase OafA/YrhL